MCEDAQLARFFGIVLGVLYTVLFAVAVLIVYAFFGELWSRKNGG